LQALTLFFDVLNCKLSFDVTSITAKVN